MGTYFRAPTMVANWRRQSRLCSRDGYYERGRPLSVLFMQFIKSLQECP
jgi:hypothetical protein